MGRFIDQGGNDFCGGRRAVAFSSCDIGLHLTSYTGP
jgi:hypothetical protein